jgi:hypothetical protein
MHYRPIGPACLVVLSVAIGPCVPASNGQVAQARRPADLGLSVAQPIGPLRPGGVGLVVVTTSTQLNALEGEAFGRPVRFWPSASATEWQGLLGVGLDAKPGSHVVTVHGTAADGETGTARITVAVGPKRFETRRLRVDPTMVNPPQEQAARIEREAKAMADAFAVVRERVWRGRFEAPVPGTATSSFGRLTVMNGEPRGRHQGADFRAATGTPVRAPNAGRVVLAQDMYFAGNTVILDHGLGVFSLLAHLSRIGVAVGDVVSRGDLVGESGATGRVTGPHLHWAVRFGDASVDPLSLMATVARMPNEDASQASH